MVAATVLITTHDRAELLPYSVATALSQTTQDIEILIIGDGVTPAAKETILKLERQDHRIRFLDFPKCPSRGETHRHHALAEARGEIVLYLDDDDLWFPDHVETLRRLLQSSDFAVSYSISILPDGALGMWQTLNLAYPPDRKWVLKGFERVKYPGMIFSHASPGTTSCVGHTLRMYRQLPYGWRLTPRHISTDLYMWQQFLSHPGYRAASGTKPTALILNNYGRRTWTREERASEIRLWSERLASSHERERLLCAAFEQILRRHIYDSTLFRLRSRVLRIPLISKLAANLLGQLA